MTAENVTRKLKRVGRAVAVTCTTIAGLSSAHLVILLGAAIRSRGRASPRPSDNVRLAVIIPAHDEQAQIATAVASVRATRYPSERRQIIVVADNCTDQTAAVAQAAGAEVWERTDQAHRGKGYALAWAFDRLLKDHSIEAACVIDADCEVSANLFGALAARLAAGADVVQASYLVSNPDASSGAALRWAGFALFNAVRPLGRDQLGLSSGLLGTGMAISRKLLLSSPWQAFSYAEDREQHMHWVLSGARVAFASEAQISSPAPDRGGSRAREARWDSGRGALAARLTPRLLSRWLRTGELGALDAALEPVLPPQSLLLGANLLAVASSWLTGARGLMRWAAASLLGQIAYVLGGLVVLNAPASVWRALLSVPRFVPRRLFAMGSSVVGRGPSEWQRTPREADE